MYALWGLTPAQEARAGTWAFIKEADGQCVANAVTQPWVFVPPRPDGYPNDAPWPPPGSPIILNPGTGGGTTAEGTASVSTRGSVTFVCTWTPSDPNEMVPKAVRIPTDALASVFWMSSSPTPTNLIGLADNDGRAVTQPREYVFDQYGAEHQGREWHAEGQRLFALSGGGEPSDGQTKTWRVTVNLKASFSGSVAVVNGQAVGGFSGAVSATAQNPVEDDRSVKLLRGVGDKEHSVLKDGNWVTYGDSRYSYLKRTLPAANPIEIVAGVFGYPLYEDKPQPVQQTFFASYEGVWSSESTFKWNPSSAGDTVTQHTQEMTQGNSVWNPGGIAKEFEGGAVEGVPHGGFETRKGIVPGGWYDAPHQGGTVKVFYKATDSDGTTADASYVLTLHDEWENSTPDNTFFLREAPNDTPHYGQSLSGWRGRKMPFSGTTPGKTSKWKITASADLNVELKADTSANFGVEDWLKISGSATTKTTFDVKTEVEYSITPGEIYPNAPTTSSFQPIVRFKVKTKHFVLDHYTDDGRDVNSERSAPLTAGPLAPPSDGKWPKQGESEVIMAEPFWAEVREDQVPPGDSDFPLPDPTPTSTPANRSAPSISAQTPTAPPSVSKPIPQPSGNFS